MHKLCTLFCSVRFTLISLLLFCGVLCVLSKPHLCDTLHYFALYIICFCAFCAVNKHPIQYNAIGLVNVDRYASLFSPLRFRPKCQAVLAAVDTNG